MKSLSISKANGSDDNSSSYSKHDSGRDAGHQNDGPQAYPLSWDEQRRLFALLPGSMAQVAPFAVNTGCREQEACRLRWNWEVPVAEFAASVFVIPADFGGRSERSGVKNGEDRVVVLNDVAGRVVEAQQGGTRSLRRRRMSTS